MKALPDILNDLDKSIDDLTSLGKHTIETYSFYNYDLFCIAILNRSVNLIRGFTSLMRDRNFLAAAPLVRIHLDTLMRLFASTLIDYNIDDFALKVLQGKHVRNLKDRDGIKMTDNYLVKKLSQLEELKWVEQLYKAGSGYIHFSNYLMHGSTGVHPKKERVLIGSIGKHDEFIDENEKIGAAIRMNQISIHIAALISLWKQQKENY